MLKKEKQQHEIYNSMIIETEFFDHQENDETPFLLDTLMDKYDTFKRK